jgi:hypothetical protein
MRIGKLVVLAVAGVVALFGKSAAQNVDLPARDGMLNSRPAPVWAVGADEGESWELLSGVRSLAFDDRDNLYVLDQGNHRILVFDASGRFVRQFGKQGGGPGEFQFPMGMVRLADGSIAVLDAGRRGYSVFDAAGVYERLVALPADVGSPRPDEFFASPAGGVLLRAMPPGFGASGIPEGKLKSPILRVPIEEGSAVTRLHEFEMDPPRVVDPGRAAGGQVMRMVMFTRPTFGKEPSWGPIAGGGIAVSESGDYRIDTFDASGRPGPVLRRPIAARKVTKRDQEDARERRRKELKGPGAGTRVVVGGSGGGRALWVGPGGGGGELSDAAIEAQVERMEFAEEIPAILRIVTDATGRIWVERSPARVGEEPSIDLLTGDGRYMGTLEGWKTPGAVSASGLAAWVEPDPDTGIERVVVRRLPADWE